MRLLKQFIYGAGYLAVFFLIGFWIYSVWFKPAATCFDNKQNQNETGIDCGGPCSPCEIKTLSPIEATNPIKYFSGDNQTVIVAEIQNPNTNWGADSFSYTFDIYPVRNEISNGVYGKNETPIKSITKTSFIYGGEIKYFVEPIEINPQDITNVKISFSNISWKPAKEFSKPTTQLRGLKTELAIQNGNRIIVSGFITNINAFPLSKIKIIGFLSNQNGIQISASKTELENVPAFAEKPFQISFPKNISLLTTSTSSLNLSQADSTKTKIYVEALR